MVDEYDVIVIGSGAGGATLAHACAGRGKRVLLLERGRRYAIDSTAHDERAMLVEKRPYDDRSIVVNGEPRRLYMGGSLGGGTALYGAALLRPSEDDFHPGRHYGDRIPRSTWDWPIQYAELEPYYTEAERLYSVAGAAGDDLGPLHPPDRSVASETIPWKPINARLVASSRARGLAPFHLPLGIDFSTCLQCGACPGLLCPNGSRRSSAQLLERSSQDRAPLRVVTEVDVLRLEIAARNRVGGVVARHRGSGESVTFRARRYVLAAGAIGSPAILLRSGLTNEWIGRNYMFHLSPLVIGLFLRKTGADSTFVKQVGYADYYLGAADFAHKIGIIQSLPVPGPLMIAKTAPVKLPASLIHAMRLRMLPLVGIVEDLPNPKNRVTVGPDGSIGLRHEFDPYDLARGERISKWMKGILRGAGAFHCIAKTFPSHEHVAHQCGTLRFGRDPEEAVLDPECRVFGHPNLFVADGSFMPTSLGVGPALTIMANALRVADIVTDEL